MKKQVVILGHDRWHYSEVLEPLMPYLQDETYEVIYSTDPEVLYQYDPAVFVNYKDPIENNQIPTPAWTDDKWVDMVTEKIKNGMGFLGMHAGLADLPADHRLVKEVHRSTFITHPAQCPVTFVSDAEHPILEGVGNFDFPTIEEFYMMQMYEELPTTVLAHIESEHGTQPAVWIHELGAGKICCITPAHNTPSLLCEPYVRLVKNAIKWVMK